MPSNVVRLDRLEERLRADREPARGVRLTGNARDHLRQRGDAMRAVMAEWFTPEELAERSLEVRVLLVALGDLHRSNVIEAEEALAEAVDHPLTDEADQDARLTRLLESVLASRFRAAFFDSHR